MELGMDGGVAPYQFVNKGVLRGYRKKLGFRYEETTHDDDGRQVYILLFLSGE
jgi:hypothetical protein